MLDSSLLIAGERQGQRIWDILELVQADKKKLKATLSAVTVLELTRRIYHAKSEADAKRLEAFVQEMDRSITVQPLTLEIARFAGKIEGEEAAKGVVIVLPDLLIDATALHLGHSVATLNVRHFLGLSVVRR